MPRWLNTTAAKRNGILPAVLQAKRTGSRPRNLLQREKKNTPEMGVLFFSGADYGARTRHLDLGKVALYQMS